MIAFLTPEPTIQFFVEHEKSYSIKQDLVSPDTFLELEAISAFQSLPNICKLVSFTVDRAHYAVHMESPSRSLLDLLHDHPRGLPMELLVSIMQPLLRAVAAMHARGFLHLALKLETIMLDDDCRPYLWDFSAARRYAQDSPSHVSRHSSLHYAPPEVWLQQPSLGPNIDCFALGVVMYALATGYMPFSEAEIPRIWTEEGTPGPKVSRCRALRKNHALFELLEMLLHADWRTRPDVALLLTHPFFTSISLYATSGRKKAARKSLPSPASSPLASVKPISSSPPSSSSSASLSSSSSCSSTTRSPTHRLSLEAHAKLKKRKKRRSKILMPLELFRSV